MRACVRADVAGASAWLALTCSAANLPEQRTASTLPNPAKASSERPLSHGEGGESGSRLVPGGGAGLADTEDACPDGLLPRRTNTATGCLLLAPASHFRVNPPK